MSATGPRLPMWQVTADPDRRPVGKQSFHRIASQPLIKLHRISTYIGVSRLRHLELLTLQKDCLAFRWNNMVRRQRMALGYLKEVDIPIRCERHAQHHAIELCLSFPKESCLSFYKELCLSFPTRVCVRPASSAGTSCLISRSLDMRTYTFTPSSKPQSSRSHGALKALLPPANPPGAKDSLPRSKSCPRASPAAHYAASLEDR